MCMVSSVFFVTSMYLFFCMTWLCIVVTYNWYICVGFHFEKLSRGGRKLEFEDFGGRGEGVWIPILYKPCDILLTLRGLILFFKILPFSNSGVSTAYILATIHFIYSKLGSFSDMVYYFYQLAYWDLKVSKRFVGLNKCSALPLLTRTGANKITHCMLAPAAPTRARGQSNWNSKLRGQRGGTAPFHPPLMGEHLLLKFPLYSLFRPKGGWKTINFCSHHHGLASDTNYKH